MPDVPKHAWTHRPRSQGGTDPLEIVLPDGAGIVSHFPRHPVHCTGASAGFTEWPGGVVVIEASQFSVAGTPTTDSSNNYSGQSFLRYTTAASSYAGAANLVLVDPASINLRDDHAYAVYYQYRLGATTTGGRVGWMSHADTPAEVTHILPASSPANTWFSMGRMGASAGLGVIRHGQDIEFRAYRTTSTMTIDLDLIIFVPHDYQDGSPGYVTDPGVVDLRTMVPDTGQESSTTTSGSDLTNWNGQCLTDTQTVNSILDPAFRWSATAWALGLQGNPQPSNEANGFAWEAGHGRHIYVAARLEGESGQDQSAFFTAAAVAWGSNGMPYSSALLWNNSWQLVYMGPASLSHEMHHLAGWVINADPGGNEAPFADDGATTVASVKLGPILGVTCLYDPQGC